MRIKIFSLFLILIVFFPSVYAQDIPTIKPYVNDFAGVLSQAEINSINSLAGEIERNTTVQIAVLTVNSTQPLDIDTYATQVFRANGIGNKDNNNGLLIVAAITDRQWRIEVGYGLEGTINDAKAGDVGRTYLVPYFQQGEYGTGLYMAVQSIGIIVQGSDDPNLISNQSNYQNNYVYSGTFDIVWWIVIFSFFLIPSIYSAFHRLARCPKDGSIMIGKDIDDKTVFTCKKCGYRKTKNKKRRWLLWPLFFGGGWSGGGGGGGGFGGGSSGGGGAGGGW
jgi:uncharacterized protein